MHWALIGVLHELNPFTPKVYIEHADGHAICTTCDVSSLSVTKYVW